ncbi:hypothetical protein F511_45170 [Dorcoceras hygrometricum]|uniref:Uncharacterized protein n=1 Tax=Dorcoceras hygrometricum TaxID=472368 RepID=A0A2Z7A3Y5_9LAMI|nr:hypothetical protein F511_45170 [Dorcoceras hygrometricum]
MTFRVVRTNQYNQDLGLIHSTNGNHLESPNEGSSIDQQVTIYMHTQNITMFPTNETWYFAPQILVSNSGGLILILTAQSTMNMFRIHIRSKEIRSELFMEVRSSISYVSHSSAIGKDPLEDFDYSDPSLQPTTTTSSRRNS